ncbi:MAG TPA: DUF3857 and transglutaminase domain-containing protein [Pyrinomonadaceae bacterium]|jgi:hypothetical protein|nr:DUF3857 and transglutaminase domain-containing protein [Pyrinomonadaceae bacterium]
MTFKLILLLLLCVHAVLAGGDNDWRPVTPAELQLKTPKVEADADAEAIFWEVRVDDSDPQSLVMKHYIRVKIFTERGREKYSKHDIPFPEGVKIKDIMARVIKADGTIVELSKADVFEREIIKTDKIKVKAKSFAVPNIEPGVIVEYRYSEVFAHGWAEDMRMVFQHDVPIESISYYFKPAGSVRYLTFNMENKFIKDKDGFYRATMQNVPAIKAEPQMPPEDEVRSWLLVYYETDLKGSSTDFWSRAGGAIVRNWEIKDTLKPGKDIKTATESIVGGATDPDEKMARLFTFCKTKIKNITFDTQLTDEQKDEIKPNKSTADTYKKLQGTAVDINELFASLATAAGFEARLAFGGNRSEKFFNPNQAHESFIHFSAVAVKVNGRWRYFDPGSLFVPYGMLTWNEEDTAVLLLGYKDFLTTETPFSEPGNSVAKRSGRFKLSEDGTLEGTVKIEYSGHLSQISKTENYKESVNKREEILKESLKKQMGLAEVSDISIENVDDPEKPFTYQYKLKVPNYAQKTGKRMFFQPGVFEYGASPTFASSSRKYPIFFHYPWSEADDIEITLPAGYELDSPDVTAPAPVADPGKIGVLQFKMNYDPKTNAVVYKRDFSFGSGGNVLFAPENYLPLKTLFDMFNKSNTQALTLKSKQ